MKRLGIVYTPDEVVDFIIRGEEDMLQHKFKSSFGVKDYILNHNRPIGNFGQRLGLSVRQLIPNHP